MWSLVVAEERTELAAARHLVEVLRCLRTGHGRVHDQGVRRGDGVRTASHHNKVVRWGSTVY